MEKADGLKCSQITYILLLITTAKPLFFIMKMELQSSQGDTLDVRSHQEGAEVCEHIYLLDQMRVHGKSL